MSSVVRYRVWSLAYSTLFGWCHTGTNKQPVLQSGYRKSCWFQYGINQTASN